MNTSQCIAAALLVFGFTNAFAEGEWKRIVLKTSTTPTVINVPDGKVLETTAAMFDTLNAGFELVYDLGGGDVIERDDFELLSRPGNSVLTSKSVGPGFFVGPSALSLRMRSGVGLVVIQYRILDNPSIPTTIGASIRIPPATTTPIIVKLQYSTDLASWTDVATHEERTADTNRFFRLSASSE